MNLFARKEQHLSPDDVALGQALADVAAIGLLQQPVTRQPEMLAEQMQAALNTLVLVEQAKGITAEHTGLHPWETFPSSEPTPAAQDGPCRTWPSAS